MSDCLFCQIVAGEVPSEKVYEDDRVLAFLDLYPLNRGHSLVVPKQHYESILEVPAPLFEALAKATQRVARALRRAYDLGGLNLLLNDGAYSGQLIPHVHFHVIPRTAGDGIHVPAGRKKYPHGEMTKVREEIVRALFASGGGRDSP